MIYLAAAAMFALLNATPVQTPNPLNVTVQFVIKAVITSPDHHPIAVSGYNGGGPWTTASECIAVLDNPDEKLALTRANFEKLAKEKIAKDINIDWVCVPNLIPEDTKT